MTTIHSKLFCKTYITYTITKTQINTCLYIYTKHSCVLKLNNFPLTDSKYTICRYIQFHQRNVKPLRSIFTTMLYCRRHFLKQLLCCSHAYTLFEFEILPDISISNILHSNSAVPRLCGAPPLRAFNRGGAE